jgi:hypothetical protein
MEWADAPVWHTVAASDAALEDEDLRARLLHEGSPDRCEVCVHGRSRQNKMTADLSVLRRRTTGRERGRSAPVGALYDFSSLIPAGLCVCSSRSFHSRDRRSC